MERKANVVCFWLLVGEISVDSGERGPSFDDLVISSWSWAAEAILWATAEVEEAAKTRWRVPLLSELTSHGRLLSAIKTLLQEGLQIVFTAFCWLWNTFFHKGRYFLPHQQRFYCLFLLCTLHLLCTFPEVHTYLFDERHVPKIPVLGAISLP